MKKIQRSWGQARITYETIICCLLVAIITLSILADCSVLPLYDWIIVKVENVEDLFFALFSVQASVAVASTAIISIITGLTNESILGISISEYLAEIKPRIFKHRRVITANIIITLVNYISVALARYNLSVALFAVSIILTIVLIKDVYLTFRGKQKIAEEIHSYILANYNSTYIKNLNADLLNAVETGSTVAFAKDINILLEIFEIETERSNYEETEIVTLILDVTADLFKKVVAQHNSVRINNMLTMVCRLYEIANQKQSKPLRIKLWEQISYDFFRGVSDLSYQQLTEEYICNRIHRALYKNLQNQKNNNAGSSIAYYSSKLYSVLSCKNDLFGKDQVYNLVTSIYQNVTGMLYTMKGDSDDFATRILISEMCNFHKILIDKGETKIIKDSFFNRYFRYSKGKAGHDLIVVITLIYLYYLSCREKDKGTETLQEHSRYILEENRKTISYFWLHMDLATFVENEHGFIQNLMHNWEYMEELKAKWIQMEYIIDDFLVLSAINKFWDKASLMRIIRHIAGGSMFSLFNRYYSSGRQKYIEELDEEFCKYFASGEKMERDVYKYESLQDVCNACYKEELLKTAQENELKDDDIRGFTDASRKYIEEYTAHVFSHFAFRSTTDKSGIIELKEIPIISITSPNSLYQEDELSSQIKDCYCSGLIRSFLCAIRKGIEFEKMPYKSKNKQSRLIELVKSAGIQGAVVIGNREEFWEEENQELLLAYTKDMHRIEHPEGYNHYFILDDQLIEFSCDNVNITFENLNEEEIARRCRKNSDGTILYNVTNDLYIPFDESELTSFVHRTWKKVKVSVDISYRLASPIVGAGIEISMDD